MKRVLYIDQQRDFFGGRLAHGFINEVTRHQWWSHWYHPMLDEEPEEWKKLLKHGDGVIYRGEQEEFIEFLETEGVPHLVLRSRVHPGKKGVPHVDDYQIGALAGEELDRLEVLHCGYLTFKGVEWSEARGVAFLQGRKEISFLELSRDEVNTFGGLEKVKGWLETLPKPAGIFAANDHLGVACLMGAEIAGLKVPDEVAVIGVDNHVDRCSAIIPNLSSIDLHPEELGRHLAYEMAARFGILTEEEKANQPPIRPPSLVVRQSTQYLSPTITYYRKSMEWIYRNALTGPGVQELADFILVSRRVLERSFKENGSPPPATVMREERMRQIRELLLRENVTQEFIARQAGFPDTPSLHNFVKRLTGKTPTQISKER